MSTVSDSNKLINFYEVPSAQKFIIKYHNPAYENTHMKHPFRIGIFGKTGQGKTQMLVNLIHRMAKTFKKIYIIRKVDETLYELLGEKMRKGVEFFKSVLDLPSIDNWTCTGQSLIIFDDVVNDGRRIQEIIAEFFIRGRKTNKVGISMCYLSQSFFQTPILIRKQLNYIALLKLENLKDINLILTNYGMGMPHDYMMGMYKDATKNELTFLKMDLGANDENRKYSLNFDQFYHVVDGDDDYVRPTLNGKDIPIKGSSKLLGDGIKPEPIAVCNPLPVNTKEEGGAVPDILKYGILGSVVKNRKQIFGSELGYTKGALKILNNLGKYSITHITIVRTPLGSPLVSTLNVASMGHVGKQIDREPFDKLYHLALYMRLTTGRSLTAEKNGHITFSDNRPKPKGEEMDVGDCNIGVHDFFDKTEQKMGNKDYFSYQSSGNNCQDFVKALLDANGLSTAETTSFVKQDVSKIIKTDSNISKLANVVTGSYMNAQTVLGMGISDVSPNRGIRYKFDFGDGI